MRVVGMLLLACVMTGCGYGSHNYNPGMTGGGGAAAPTMTALSPSSAKVGSAVEFIINRGVKYSVLSEIKLTPRSHKVLRLAIDEARSLNDTLIGTEHLLLGMLREGEGIAAGVLASMNVYVENARSELKRIRDTSTGNQESQ